MPCSAHDPSSFRAAGRRRRNRRGHGVVLFVSLARRRTGPLATRVDFSVQRCFRSYPALLVSLLTFALVVVGTGESVSGRAFWSNALLLDNPIQGESWTPQVELLAVPLILASCFAHRGGGHSTVTDFARLRGLSTSRPSSTAM